MTRTGTVFECDFSMFFTSMEVLHSKFVLFDSYTRDHGLCLKTAIKSRSPSANKKLNMFKVSRPPYNISRAINLTQNIGTRFVLG